MQVVQGLLGNRPFRFMIHFVFVATLSLLVNEVYFFQQSQNVAREFVQATQGLVLYEPNSRVTQEKPLDFNGRLETYLLRIQATDGTPQLEVLTDATSSTFFKLDHAPHIIARSLNVKDYTDSTSSKQKIFLGRLPTMAPVPNQELVHPLTQALIYWKLGVSLFQESFLLKHLGWGGWILFVICCISSCVFFAKMCRDTSQKVGQMRFLGVPNRVLIPLVFVKNGGGLIISFIAIALIFTFLEMPISLGTYLISFCTALIIAGIGVFFRRLDLDFKK